jgi:hypothetical protein
MFVCFWVDSPQWDSVSSFTRFLDTTHRRTTVGRTPLDECSARRTDLYLTTHNIHNRQTSMPPVRFDTTITAGEPPQTYTLDCEATGTGIIRHTLYIIYYTVYTIHYILYSIYYTVYSIHYILYNIYVFKFQLEEIAFDHTLPQLFVHTTEKI